MHASLVAAAEDRRLNRTDHRVLLYLFARLEDDEWRAIKRSTVASATRTDRSSVTRSLQRLVAFGYLKRGPSEPGTNQPLKTYRRGSPREPDTRGSQTRFGHRRGGDVTPRKVA